jgi:hypothetical protein
MERSIPLVGWIVIGFVVLMVILLNFSLYSAWKGKNNKNPFDNLKKSGQLLRQPWQKEDEQLEKLAHATAKLKREKVDSPKDTDHIQN